MNPLRIIAICCWCLIQTAATWGIAQQPNIVLFLVDDMGWQDTSVPFWQQRTPFNEHFRTPHMQQLAAQGIRFTQAYSAAVCSPTRTSIMTGQNAARHRVTNWTLLASRDQSGKTARLGPPSQWRLAGLQPDAVTLPKLLRAAGYRTIHCGKAHWGAYDTPGADPTRLGFDVNIAGHPAGAPGSYQASDNFGNQQPGTHTKPWGVPGLEKYHGSDIHLTDALAAEACAALTDAVQSNKPFFLYMAPYAVHTPIQPHRRFIANYRDKQYAGTDIKIPEVEARFASMVEGMDDCLGQILRRLEELAVAQNTFIIFTSDNGSLSAHARGTTPRGTGLNTHCWPLREGKGSAYEGGTRVPFIAAWAKPDRENSLQKQWPIKAGSISNAPILCEDLFPTICRLAAVQQWNDKAPHVDGQDNLPLIAGQSSAANANSDQPRRLLFHYPHVWGPAGPGYQPHSALRQGPWKVIYFYQPQRWELYNLDQDLGEQHDLAGQQPARTKQLAAQLMNLLDQRGAQFPTDRQTGQPERPQL